MPDDAELVTVSFTDAFYYGLRMVFSSIVFIVLLLIIQAVGGYVVYMGVPHCCVDPVTDGVDNDGDGEADEADEADIELSVGNMWEYNGQLTDWSYAKIIVGFIVYIVAAIGFFAILVAIWYKLWVDIISRSDFHFSKRDSF